MLAYLGKYSCKQALKLSEVGSKPFVSDTLNITNNNHKSEKNRRDKKIPEQKTDRFWLSIGSTYV